MRAAAITFALVRALVWEEHANTKKYCAVAVANTVCDSGQANRLDAQRPYGFDPGQQPVRKRPGIV